MKTIYKFKPERNQKSHAKQQVGVNGCGVNERKIESKPINDVNNPAQKQKQKRYGSGLAGRGLFQLLIK